MRKEDKELAIGETWYDSGNMHAHPCNDPSSTGLYWQLRIETISIDHINS